MQRASGGRTRLGSVPTVRMSPLLARIVLNQSGERFICWDVSEWNVCSEGKQKKKTHKTWDVSGVRNRRGAIQIQSANIFPPFSLSNANVGLSFPEWTRWMSRMCRPHAHFDVGRCWWRWRWRRRWGEGRGSWLSRFRFLRSVRPSGRHPGKNESFITISRLARLTDVTAGHQIPQILSFVTLEEKKSGITAECSRAPFPSVLPHVTPRYNEDNMANQSWTTRGNEMTSHSTGVPTLPKQPVSSLWMIL